MRTTVGLFGFHARLDLVIVMDCFVIMTTNWLFRFVSEHSASIIVLLFCSDSPGNTVCLSLGFGLVYSAVRRRDSHRL